MPDAGAAAFSSDPKSMLSPKEIRDSCQRLWDGGQVLRAWMGVEELFPWSPDLGMNLPDEPGAAQECKAAIESGCKCAGGEGYRIEYLELESYLRLPQRVVFDTPLDVIGYLGESRELGEFARISREIRRRFPALKEWIEAQPMQVLEHAPHWPRILAAVEWFLAQPHPDPQLRELAIPGVDARFIEEHQHLLMELLDRLRPAEAAEQDRS